MHFIKRIKTNQRGRILKRVSFPLSQSTISLNTKDGRVNLCFRVLSNSIPFLYFLFTVVGIKITFPIFIFYLFFFSKFQVFEQKLNFFFEFGFYSVFAFFSGYFPKAKGTEINLKRKLLCDNNFIHKLCWEQNNHLLTRKRVRWELDLKPF